MFRARSTGPYPQLRRRRRGLGGVWPHGQHHGQGRPREFRSESLGLPNGRWTSGADESDASSVARQDKISPILWSCWRSRCLPPQDSWLSATATQGLTRGLYAMCEAVPSGHLGVHSNRTLRAAVAPRSPRGQGLAFEASADEQATTILGYHCWRVTRHGRSSKRPLPALLFSSVMSLVCVSTGDGAL